MIKKTLFKLLAAIEIIGGFSFIYLGITLLIPTLLNIILSLSGLLLLLDGLGKLDNLDNNTPGNPTDNISLP